MDFVPSLNTFSDFRVHFIELPACLVKLCEPSAPSENQVSITLPSLVEIVNWCASRISGCNDDKIAFDDYVFTIFVGIRSTYILKLHVVFEKGDKCHLFLNPFQVFMSRIRSDSHNKFLLCAIIFCFSCHESVILGFFDHFSQG